MFERVMNTPMRVRFFGEDFSKYVLHDKIIFTSTGSYFMGNKNGEQITCISEHYGSYRLIYCFT